MPERRQRGRFVLPLFLAFILIMSAFGVVLSSFSEDAAVQTDSVTAGGAVFRPLPQGGWSVEIDGRTLILQFGPSEFEAVEFAVDVSALQQAQKIYLTQLPGEQHQSALADFYQNMKPVVPVFLACEEDGPGCESLPLKNCDDALNGVAVIALEYAEESSVSLEGLCYKILGDPLFVTKAVDRLVLGYFGVSL